MGKLILIALVAVSALSAALEPVGSTAAESPRWYPEYEPARAVARDAGRPLFVTFR
jgi:hypothetical protein